MEWYGAGITMIHGHKLIQSLQIDPNRSSTTSKRVKDRYSDTEKKSPGKDFREAYMCDGWMGWDWLSLNSLPIRVTAERC